MDSKNSGYQRFQLVVLPLLIIFSVDQFTKIVARFYLKDVSYSFWNGFLKLKLLFNPGVFLGLGSNLHPTTRLLLFSVFPLSAAFIGLFYLWRCKLPNIFILIWSICCASLISNILGRAFSNGLVTDFIILSIGPLRTGVFNFADFVDLPGIAMMLYLFWKVRKGPCANCGNTMAVRKPGTINQKLSGNFSCPSCGCEFNAYGCVLHA